MSNIGSFAKYKSKWGRVVKVNGSTITMRRVGADGSMWQDRRHADKEVTEVIVADISEIKPAVMNFTYGTLEVV